MITVSAFAWVPDFARGFVRDLRVRWALEEAGESYRTRLLGQGDKNAPEYLALQPFGQVPSYEEEGLALFESGAIVLHIGARCPALLPEEPGARARATQWVLAALNSVEPSVAELGAIDAFYRGQDWTVARRPAVEAQVRTRCGQLSAALGDKPYLDGGRFTAGDLMMASVLRNLEHTDIVSSDARLAAYLRRCTERPAFGRALAAQLADFKDAA